MAECKIATGTALVFKAADGDAAITLASLADGAARQSVKLDLGEPRAEQFAVHVEIETGAAAPAAGTCVEFYWSSSPHATAGTQNDGGASGTDAAYKAAEEDEWVVQLQLIGVLVMTNDATTVQETTFVFAPPHRYGSLIVKNETGQAFEANDDEHQITFTPLVNTVT